MFSHGAFLGAAPAFPAPNVYDLAFPGAGAAGIATAGFTFTRTSTAWDDALVSYAAGVPVITAGRGYYGQGAATNFFLNSNSPATQTIASMAAGTYTCWITGSGSVAVSGGASGTATAAAPFVFTLASTLSCTFTVSGSVTFGQVENSLYATLPIVTAGAAVARTVATCTASRGAITAGTVAIKARSAQGSASVNQVLFVLDSGGTTNRIRLDRSGGNSLRLTQTTGGVDTTNSIGTLAAGTDFTLVLAFAAGDQIVKSSAWADVTNTLALPASALTSERLLAAPGSSSPWDGSIYRVARWATRLDNATVAAILSNF